MLKDRIQNLESLHEYVKQNTYFIPQNLDEGIPRSMIAAASQNNLHTLIPQTHPFLTAMMTWARGPKNKPPHSCQSSLIKLKAYNVPVTSGIGAAICHQQGSDEPTDGKPTSKQTDKSEIWDMIDNLITTYHIRTVAEIKLKIPQSILQEQFCSLGMQYKNWFSEVLDARQFAILGAGSIHEMRVNITNQYIKHVICVK